MIDRRLTPNQKRKEVTPMPETYQFVWGQVEQIERAICLAKRIMHDAEYSHIETASFDLDTDKIGIRVRIPHDKVLTEERKEL